MRSGNIAGHSQGLKNRMGANDMNRLLTRAICSSFLLALTATTSSGANLLTNPGFETGNLIGWFAASAVLASVTVETPENGPSAPGTHSALLDNREWVCFLRQLTVPGTAVPGTVFYSFDLKLLQASNGGYVSVSIFANQLDGIVVGGPGMLGHYSPADWTTFQGSFVAPANMAYLTIEFLVNMGPAVSALADNVDLHQVPVVSVESTTWDGMKALYR